jgi:hypothetical protein
MSPDAVEFSKRIGGFCAKVYQGGDMAAEDIADGIMLAAIKTASVVLSRPDLCEWLRRLAAEIETSEPVGHPGGMLQ